MPAATFHCSEQSGAGEGRQALLPRELRPLIGSPSPALPAGAEGFTDGVARMTGWRASPVCPVVAIVGLSQREALATARQYGQDSRNTTLPASAGVMVLGLVACVLSPRQAA